MPAYTRPRPAPPPPAPDALVIVLRNAATVHDRELAAPADALRVAIVMLARRGRLDAGDTMTVALASS